MMAITTISPGPRPIMPNSEVMGSPSSSCQLCLDRPRPASNPQRGSKQPVSPGSDVVSTSQYSGTFATRTSKNRGGLPRSPLGPDRPELRGTSRFERAVDLLLYAVHPALELREGLPQATRDVRQPLAEQ